MTATFLPCSSCGSRHLAPAPCGLTFRERLLSVRLDSSATPTRTPHNGYDRESIRKIFGEDAKDRYLEETKGRGGGVRDDKGNLWHRDVRSGELVPMTDQAARETYLSGPIVDED